MAWRSASSARGIAKADLNNYDRDTSATRLQSCFCRRWRVMTSRRPKENCLCCTHLYTFVHIATEKDPQLQQSSTKSSLWFQNLRYGSKTYDLAPKQTFWLQNSSREDPPEYASAAWDHWTGRDCATGRPSRSLCLDLTSGPPLDAPASHSHPTP